MYMAYCKNCGRKTGHKRSLGIGTLLAVILTGGLWLIAILSYPDRCIICGNPETGTSGKHSNQKLGYIALLVILGVFFLILWSIFGLHSSFVPVQ